AAWAALSFNDIIAPTKTRVPLVLAVEASCAILRFQVGQFATIGRAVFLRPCVRGRAHRCAKLRCDPFIEVIGGIERNAAGSPEAWPPSNPRKLSKRAGGAAHAPRCI